MSPGWVLLHAGALGDLALALQVAPRVPAVRRRGALTVYSTTTLGNLRTCFPEIDSRALDTLRAAWLFGHSGERTDETDDDAPPPVLADAIAERSVISALGSPRSHVHERLLRLAPAALYSYDPRPRPDLASHITHQWTSDLAASGLLVEHCAARRRGAALRVDEALRARGVARLRAAGVVRRACLIHPGSGGRAKCWPLEAFLDVARTIRGRNSGDVGFVLGPVERERMSVAECAAIEREFPVLLPESGDALIEVLAAGAVLLSSDSGPAHVAALIGTPTVTMFGPTSAARWRPLGPAACVLCGDPQRGEAWGLHAEEAAAMVGEMVARGKTPAR